MARRPSEIVQLKLRFPEALRRLLNQAAKDNKRSMNGEIVSRLQESFLRQNLAALMREHAENTANKLADRVINRIEEQRK